MSTSRPSFLYMFPNNFLIQISIISQRNYRVHLRIEVIYRIKGYKMREKKEKKKIRIEFDQSKLITVSSLFFGLKLHVRCVYSSKYTYSIEWKIICSRRLYRYFTFFSAKVLAQGAGRKKKRSGREGDSVKCVIGNKCNAFLNSWSSRCLLGNLLFNSRPLIAKSSLSRLVVILSHNLFVLLLYTHTQLHIF